ncbi:MAG: hypothetical protein H6704_15840 [Myxococcales bacterium]|nr:hypothetical protein [Myxococcales bacterium]
MRRAPALLGLMLVFGCGDDEAAPGATPTLDDPARAAEDFLRHHAFDPPDALRARFVREVDPADFPLRLLVEDPAAYRFDGLWRQRTVDGRLVVEALVEVDGAPRVVEFWLERQADAWRIAGWDPTSREVEPAAAAPPAGARIPPPFAPAAFRGAPPVRTVPLPASADAPRAAPTRSPMRVVIGRPTLEATCTESAALERAVRGRRADLGACHAIAFGAAVRPGRVTLELTVEGATFAARVVETTLIDERLGACLARVLGELPAGDHGACTARVPITFAPPARRR